MIIAIDFDGTIVKHAYPEIGDAVPNAITILKMLKDQGHKLILYTMRSGITLEDANNYLISQGIDFDALNCNPWQSTWTTSPKVYAELYIDDAAFGCPTRQDFEFERPWVDWLAIHARLLQLKILVDEPHPNSGEGE